MSSSLIRDKEINIKDFRRVEKINNGQFGIVYKVRSKEGKIYAAKVIFCGNDEKKCNEVIDREVSIMMYDNHPTIIKFIGYSKKDFTSEPNVTIIMDYASNKTLSDIFSQVRRGCCPDDYNNTKRQINLAGIAKGMKYLHDLNIIHRDLKSLNILLDENFYPHISDFGLSKITENDRSFSQSIFCGTLAYMAPEIILKNNINKKVDVYAFGIIMYEIVTDSIPYLDLENKKMTDFVFYQKVVNDNYRPNFGKIHVKSSLKKLIDQCLLADPYKRPSFDELFNKLSNFKSKEYFLDDVDVVEFEDYIEDINKYVNPTEKLLLKKIAFFDNKNKKLDKENQQLKQKNEKTESENQQLKQKNEKTESENQQLKQKNEKKEFENQQLKQKNEKTESENQQLKQKNVKIESENQQLKQKNAKTESENQQLKQKNAKTESENQQLKQKNEKTESENQQLKQKIEKVLSENQQLKQKYEKSKSENQQSKKEDAKNETLTPNANKGKMQKDSDASPKPKVEKAIISPAKLTEAVKISEFNAKPLQLQKSIILDVINYPYTKNKPLFYKIQKLILFLQQNDINPNSRIKIIDVDNENLKDVSSNSVICIDFNLAEYFFNQVTEKTTKLLHVLNEFDLFSVELNYPSDSYSCILNTLKEYKNSISPYCSKLYLSLLILKSEKEYRDFSKDDISYVSFDPSIVKINDKILYECESVIHITIPSSVTSIGKKAFYNCSIKQIKLNNSLISIGDLTFFRCPLTQITIPASVETIGLGAFEQCRSLEKVSILSSETEFQFASFILCEALTQINIPSEMTIIPESSFCQCKALQKITIPSSVTEIEDRAFFNCLSLTEITIPSSVTEIGDWVFFNCISLTEITIPSSVIKIGEGAFEDCISLKNVHIKSLKINFGDEVFKGCKSLWHKPRSRACSIC